MCQSNSIYCLLDSVTLNFGTSGFSNSLLEPNLIIYRNTLSFNCLRLMMFKVCGKEFPEALTTFLRDK